MLKRLLNQTTHRVFELPILVLMPHSRCNCRCVMCDIWKANAEKKELSVDLLEKHLPAIKKLGVRRIALSGGEALMHSNLWKFCEALKTVPVKISLLSTGISIKNNAPEIVRYCDDVIVSLDGNSATHNAVRNIPSAFEKLEEGIRSLKQISPGFRVTGRTVLQKRNFHDLKDIILAAKQLRLDQISFLPADVSSEAFNRPQPWDIEHLSAVSLNHEEVKDLEHLIRKSFIEFKQEFDSKFISESRDKMLDIPRYYKALLGEETFPVKSCNAPWISAVVESNGDVLPCFFHKPYGNIHHDNLGEIINSKKAVSFRKYLNVQADPVCQRCVCSIHVPVWSTVN